MIVICIYEINEINNRTTTFKFEIKRTSKTKFSVIGILLLCAIIAFLILIYFKYKSNRVQEREDIAYQEQRRVQQEEERRVQEEERRVQEEESEKKRQIEKTLYCLKKIVRIVNLLSLQYFMPNLSLEEKEFLTKNNKEVKTSDYNDLGIKRDEIIFQNEFTSYQLKTFLNHIEKKVIIELKELKVFLENITMTEEANSIVEKVKNFAKHMYEVWEVIQKIDIEYVLELIQKTGGIDCILLIEEKLNIYITIKGGNNKIIRKASKYNYEIRRMIFDLWLDFLCFPHCAYNNNKRVIESKDSLINLLFSYAQIIPLSNLNMHYGPYDDFIYHFIESIYVRKEILDEKIQETIKTFNEVRNRICKLQPISNKNKSAKDSYIEEQIKYMKYIELKEQHIFVQRNSQRIDFEKHLEKMKENITSILTNSQNIEIQEKNGEGVFIDNNEFITVKEKENNAEFNIYCEKGEEILIDIKNLYFLLQRATNYLKYLVKIEKDNTYTLVEYYKTMNKETKKMINKVPLIKDIAQEIIEFYALKLLIVEMKEALIPKRPTDKEKEELLKFNKIHPRVQIEWEKIKQEEIDRSLYFSLSKKQNKSVKDIVDEANLKKAIEEKKINKIPNTKISWTI